MAQDLGLAVAQLIGNREALDRLEILKYLGEGVGEPTLRDIVTELKKPGRDPRADFEPPKFREDIEKLEDLTPGLQLEGVVTNVTAFGAFVDVGVHQDGLIHVSQLSDRFVKDPAEVVKVGDKIKVRVLEVDLSRKRISLSARSPDAQAARSLGQAEGQGGPQGRPAPRGPQKQPAKQDQAKFGNNPFAKLLKR
jgi:uncharacterized protein